MSEQQQLEQAALAPFRHYFAVYLAPAWRQEDDALVIERYGRQGEADRIITLGDIRRLLNVYSSAHS